MKLNILPPRQGVLWVKLGVKTFFRQPLALSGLFFIFMALMSILSMVPVLGNALALALLPGVTLGLMAATQEAVKGKFPMPTVLLSGFRAGRQRCRWRWRACEGGSRRWGRAPCPRPAAMKSAIQ